MIIWSTGPSVGKQGFSSLQALSTQRDIERQFHISSIRDHTLSYKVPNVYDHKVRFLRHYFQNLGVGINGLPAVCCILMPFSSSNMFFALWV